MDTQAPQVKLSSLLRYVRPYRRRILWGMVLLLLTNGLEKTVPYMLKQAVDALASARFDTVRDLALLVVLLAVWAGLTRVGSRVFIFNSGRDVEFDLRNEMLARLHVLGPSFFQRMPTGETMSRAINDLSQVRAMIGFGFLNLVNSLVAYPITLAFMLAMSPELTLYAILPYPLLILAARGLARLMFSRSRAQQQALGELSSRVQEHLAGVRVIRAFNNEAAQAERFVEANEVGS